MKRNYFFLLIAVFTVTVSCQKWLQVQPEDKFTEEQTFRNEQGFIDELNGIYILMGQNNLYGNHLTLTTVELLAQRYYTTGTSLNTDIASYEYQKDNVKKVFAKIWEDSYIAIANVNKLLENLETYKANISADKARLIKGEALGLRAFLHFDLLRLYGPGSYTNDPMALSIPYYHKLGQNVVNFSTASDVIQFVLTDLEEASKYMDQDPALTQGSLNNNHLRFNYYAVQGLKARVLLWKNDKTGAYQAAKTIIDKSALFPWIIPNKITGDNENPDRVFSTELLFAAYSRELYNDYNRYFYYELSSESLLASGSAAFINTIYENNSNDYRKDYIWKVPPTGVAFPTFFKYADVVQKDAKQPQRFTIPLIRLSEMYYIAAECATDLQEGLSYLNTVRNHRGISSLSTTNGMENEILKEYRKEFYGEGQLWYYYKRKQISNIISPSNLNGFLVPSSAWAIPIPEEELNNR
ncbi:RagB/SusD family nutrient uptake outer membrane protein [Sphingobacterium spiritivorum]|uniref:RagB/SusD family nutrient uptake outer membrane protein n=1 Tax=Sphingobacterium spiritivorum TaxID=258 RepID=UPI003DA25940